MAWSIVPLPSNVPDFRKRHRPHDFSPCMADLQYLERL